MARPLPELGSATRGEASTELARLVVGRRELDSRLDALDAEQRQAAETVARLGAELADLERQAAGGTKVSEAQRTKAEQELAKARAAAAQPWGERRVGVQAAIADADTTLGQFVAEHFGELVDELLEDGVAAAEAVDGAARALISAYHERMAVEARVSSLCAMIRAPRPGDIEGTKAEQAVRAAEALLEQGGEQAPVLRHDPRQPRHGQVLAEAEPAA